MKTTKKPTKTKQLSEVDKLIKNKKFELRDHQKEFIYCVNDNDNPFGLVRQTCGAGKTLEQALLIAMKIHEAEKENRKAIILVGSHRLLLNAQLIREYLKYIKNDDVCFANLSTDCVVKMKDDLKCVTGYGDILGSKSLFDVNSNGLKSLMERSLKNRERSKHLIIITTSVRLEMKTGDRVHDGDKTDVMYNVMHNQNRKFDTVIIDEAHKVISKDALDVIKTYAETAYCFTATPRFNQGMYTGFNEMIDCSLSFKDAVEKNYVLKPTLKVMGITSKNPKSKEKDYETELVIEAFNDLSEDFKKSPAVLLVFTDSIDSIDKIRQKLVKNNYNVYSFSSEKIDDEHHKMGGCYHNNQELTKVEALSRINKDEKAKIIINAYMITEGIDLPNINGVAIMCKKSDSSLYQASMRGCRKHKDKKTYNIYVPYKEGFMGEAHRVSDFLCDLIHGFEGCLNYGMMREDIALGSSKKDNVIKGNFVKKQKEIISIIKNHVSISIDTWNYENNYAKFLEYFKSLSYDEKTDKIFEIYDDKNHEFHDKTSELLNQHM